MQTSRSLSSEAGVAKFDCIVVKTAVSWGGWRLYDGVMGSSTKLPTGLRVQHLE